MHQVDPLKRAITTYARPYSRHLVLSVVFGLLALAAGVSVPQVTKTIIDRVDGLNRHAGAPHGDPGILGLAALLLVLGSVQAIL
ncbi:MAG TPA: hypothetical protein VGR61_10735, partial [Candidatus Dormibacteraeota bacterium]|nr:hypothetical protein [Candidatus Dormibacteraeota bacterium]